MLSPGVTPLSSPCSDVRTSLKPSRPDIRRHQDNTAQQDATKPEALACFDIGYPWLRDHLDDLLMGGWTPRELFGRGRHAWPNGNWGAAWLPTWGNPSKVPRIGSRGEIIFTFTANSQQIQHAAWPNASNPAIKATRGVKAVGKINMGAD
jgi:hypothetical protein